jgi:hypothetical protein
MRIQPVPLPPSFTQAFAETLGQNTTDAYERLRTQVDIPVDEFFAYTLDTHDVILGPNPGPIHASHAGRLAIGNERSFEPLEPGTSDLDVRTSRFFPMYLLPLKRRPVPQDHPPAIALAFSVPNLRRLGTLQRHEVDLLADDGVIANPYSLHLPKDLEWGGVRSTQA